MLKLKIREATLINWPICFRPNQFSIFFCVPAIVFVGQIFTGCVFHLFFYIAGRPTENPRASQIKLYGFANYGCLGCLGDFILSVYSNMKASNEWQANPDGIIKIPRRLYGRRIGLSNEKMNEKSHGFESRHCKFV